MRNIISKFLFTLLALSLGFGQVWATDLCSATLNGISSNSNTTGVAQTGCTMKWNSVTSSGSDVVTIGSISFYKFSGSSSYVQLILTSGSFQAGDVVTVTATSNGSNKSILYSLHSDGGNKATAQTVSKTETVDIPYTLVAADIESDGSIKIFRGGNTNIRFGSFSVSRTSSCDAGDPGDISKGALVGGTLTLEAEGSAASGDTWYWQTAADGTSTSNSGSSFGVTEAGTYYIRSYNTAADCWSDAKSFTVQATDLVANYTVTYMDGLLPLGNEVVAVGSNPTATGITTAKDLYTFESWQLSGSDIALDDASWASVAADASITLTARYSANYAFGTYSFVNVAEVGTAPNKLTMTDGSTVNVPAGSRVDNIYFSAMAIKYESGASDALNDYKGWKINTNAATIKFLVENDCQVKIAIGEKTALNVTYTPAGGVETTVSQAKDTETPYNVEGGTLVTLTTTSSNTTTLKKIAINSLFNVTYTDGTGDASGSASDVAEVTLPAPSATTVGGSTFTGWTANQIVKVGGVDQAIGTELAAGTVVELTANTTFTAVWVATSDFDVRFFQGYGSNEQIGTTQSISTGNYATPEADPSRSGYRFLGWSYDATEAHIVNVSEYAITAATDFTAMWIQQFEVTFNLQGYGSAIAPQTIDDGGKVAKPADPYEVGQEFLGWFKESTCDNAWNFATDVVTEPTELFAKWVAFTGCVMLRPATSGSAPSAVGDEIVMQAGSTGATMTALANVDKLTYTTNGLQFGSTSGVKVNVVLANEMVVGTTISMKLVAAGDKTRGLFLYTSAGAKIDAFTCWVDGVNPASSGAEATFTYTVVAGDGLEGTNEFQLWRNNTVILNTLKVESCGSAIIYHDLTYAVDPADKATVTLGASSVREGLTTTAEYSAIDDAYDFDEWQISGAGATLSDAHANPVTITMGTADAEVTLKLKAALPKHSVTFQMNGHGVAPDGQMIKEGAKVLKPEDPVADGWEFLGWYKESTFDNEWDFDVDEMGTTDIILYAKWLDETGVIKLMDGSTVNTTNFVSPGTATTVTINEVEHNCLTAFSSNRTSLAGTKPTDVVQYNATTNKAMMQVTFYNKHATSEKTVYVWKVEEGDESATPIEITLPAKSLTKTEYFEFNSSKNRSFYVTVADKSNTGIIQVKVFDNGETALKRAGQVGYSVNMNKGRMCAITNTATSFEGLTMTTSSDYAVLNNSNLSTKSYVSFSITSPVILSVTKSGGKFYVSQNPDEKGTIYNTNQELDLNATGTWYVGSETSGSAASFTKFEFKAPKCEKPVFNALDNSELCSGEPFEALDGTGTVSDGGTVTYEWFAEGESTVLATTATFTPSADGSYFVVATNSLEGFADNVATSDVVTVTHYAMVEITSAPKDVRDDVGAAATLTVAASGKNLSYQWFTCDDVIGTGAVEIPGETNASLDVTVPDGTQYYRVEVASDCGTAYVVAKVEKWVDFTQVNVSENTSWDFTTCADAEIKLTDATTPKKGEEYLMANIRGVHYDDPAFNAQALIFAGEYIYRNVTGKPLGAIKLKFTTTVDGFVTVRFADNGNNNRCLRVTDSEGVEFSQSSASNSDIQEFTTFVHAGDIEIMGVKEDHTGENQYVRIFNLAFEKVDYSRAVNSGRIGTICLPNGGVIKEASLYEVSYIDNTSKKIFFDEILTGELIAGRPYVFLPNEGAKYMGVEFLDAANASAGSYHGLVGFIGADADAETSVPDDENCYIIQNNQYRQVLAGADARIKSYRAYLRLPDVPTSAPSLAPGRRRISMGMAGEQVATGVDNLNASETPMKMIIDGKMYILRGEKLYDATGRLVK